MSCEPIAPRRRTVLGWLLLPPIAAMIAVYGYVVMLIANPHVDEAYARTFLTAEFAVFPTVDAWKPGNGLDYTIGTYVDFSQPERRNWLARFDWIRVDTPVVRLRGTSGRIFLHVTGETEPASRRHKLTLSLKCHLGVGHASELEVSVNGRAVGSADCSEGAVTIEADLAAGLLGAKPYDMIEIARPDGSVIERIATRLGLRANAVELIGMAVDGG